MSQLSQTHKKILVLPDTQIKAGVPLDHLSCAGRYIVEKKPDVVVMIGDWADMPSLSSYDVGKRSFEGRRYKTDIEASHRGMKLLLSPIWDYNKKRAKDRRYAPRLVMCLGNHEDRIHRAVESDPKLEGVIGLKDLGYEDYGWEVYPFLQPVVIEGVAFSHYFPSGVLGRPTTTARALIMKMHMSCVAGHMQGRDIAYAQRADGTNITAIIAGSFYQHDEDYLSPIANQRWRGLVVCHQVNNGSYDEMMVSIDYLQRKYG